MRNIFILISDRKVGNDFRDRIVSGKAKPAEHNGHIWSRASTKHGAILAGKNPRFLLDISIKSSYRAAMQAALYFLGRTGREVLHFIHYFKRESCIIIAICV